MAEKNYFEELASISFEGDTKAKNNLTYIPWTKAWKAVKTLHPDAQYKVYENEIGRFWFDDGRTGWVKCSVTINEIEHIEYLAILDFKNKAIPADNITSQEATKAMQRAITKACARHGCAMYIYEGEEIPGEEKEIKTLQTMCLELIKKKCALSDEAKEKVAKICKDADSEANGDPKLMTDIDTLKASKTEEKLDQVQTRENLNETAF